MNSGTAVESALMHVALAKTILESVREGRLSSELSEVEVVVADESLEVVLTALGARKLGMKYGERLLDHG